jgi:hypothetical protein
MRILGKNILLLFGNVVIGGVIDYFTGKIIVGFLKLIFK